MKTPRVGIIGCGHVAVREHLPAVRNAGGEVVALVDVNEPLAAEQARLLHVPHVFADLTSMLKKVEVDVVALCTPSQTHHRLALEAIAAGKHLYIEKPMTENARQLTEVIEAAEKAGISFLAGSNHPYRDNVVHLRRRIAAGELGDIYALDCFKLRTDAVPLDDGRATRPIGVGFYSSVHRIDVALYLLGVPEVAWVSARTYNHFALARAAREGIEKPSGTVEDSIIATIHFKNGCTLTLRDIHGAHMEEPNFMQCWFGDMTLLGTRAGARLHPLTIYRTAPGGGQQIEIPQVNNDVHTSHNPAYRYFFNCLREGVKPEGAGHRALQVMRILDAFFESAARDGEQVTLS